MQGVSKGWGRAAGAVALVLAASGTALAQDAGWQHMHPGGGGQVQGLYLDPSVPGRMYECSDVEGMYVSHDWGATWEAIGQEIIHHMVFYVRPVPSDSDVLYAGTLHGLSKSTDRGKTWDTLIGGYASAAMDFDPFDTQNLIVGHSWIIKDSQLPSQGGQPQQQTTGPRFVMVSNDGGSSFRKISYSPVGGYKQVYTVTYNPAVRNEVFLGAHAGLFRSRDGGNTWAEIKGPAGIANWGTNGAAITPDGKYIVATFGNEGTSSHQTRPYAALVEGLKEVGDVANNAWQLIDARSDSTTGAVLQNAQWWSPKVDPRSKSGSYGLTNTYKILLSSLSNTPLMEGTFVDQGTSLSGTFARIWDRSDTQNPPFSFAMGWNLLGPNTRQNAYAPMSWDDAPVPEHLSTLVAPGTTRRFVITSNNQQVYFGNAESPYTSWVVLSNRLVATVNSFEFYRTRGFSSTVNYDMDAFGNYYNQGMADNGFMESYDHGFSWGASQVTGSGGTVQSNADAVHIVKPQNAGEEPIVLVGTAPGFGGGADTAVGTLRAKRLTGSPISNMGAATWKAIAGGNTAAGAAGLVGTTQGPRIWYIESHPTDTNSVYVGTHLGLYYSDDIRARFAGTGGTFARILEAPESLKFGRIYVDPTSTSEQAVLYLKAGGAQTHNLYLLIRSGTTFTREQIVTPTPLGQLDDFAYWRRSLDGAEYMAYSDGTATVWWRHRPVGQAEWTAWEVALTQQDILAIKTPSWWNWAGRTPDEEHFQSSMEITLTGLVGHEDAVHVGSYVEFGKHGLMMLRGRRLDGGWHWEDWTGTQVPGEIDGYMTVPRVWRAKAIEPVAGRRMYAAASRGAGLLVRAFAPSGVGVLTATALDADSIRLTWADLSNDETGFRIERSLDGSSWDEVASVGADVTMYTDTGLTENTTHRYRVRAANDEGVSLPSNVAEATTPGVPPTISGFTVSPSIIWPPNHQMMDITLSYAVSDNVDAPEAILCVPAVQSSEAENALGDGTTAPDSEVVSARLVRVRAERSGTGGGRIYSIRLTCTDTRGNAASADARVVVPHNRGK